LDTIIHSGSVANLKFRARETVRPRHHATEVSPKSKGIVPAVL
jgi:hypothetical protein